MSQAVFAQLLNVSTKTVQSWEQGSRKPSQASLRLIQILEQSPESVFQAAGLPLPQSTNGADEIGTKRVRSARTRRNKKTVSRS
jgi:transcriptional regulator with XRE-family HTH domain